LSAAETGHLVFGTLHTNDAKQSIDRILDTYGPEAQHQIRVQLAKCLLAVASQRLLKRADGQGRVAVQEIMINTPLVQKLIEDGRIGGIGKAIEDSVSFHRMQSPQPGSAPARQVEHDHGGRGARRQRESERSEDLPANPGRESQLGS
jgi:twitching motility protein PilT